jgi:hypothetical protein
MTLESLKPPRSADSKSGPKTKAIIIIGVIVLSVIVVFSVVTALSTGLTTSYSYTSTKGAICTSKVLELAQKGIIREVGGYNGAIYECIHMHGLSSIYGKASE